MVPYFVGGTYTVDPQASSHRGILKFKPCLIVFHSVESITTTTFSCLKFRFGSFNWATFVWLHYPSWIHCYIRYVNNISLMLCLTFVMWNIIEREECNMVITFLKLISTNVFIFLPWKIRWQLAFNWLLFIASLDIFLDTINIYHALLIYLYSFCYIISKISHS